MTQLKLPVPALGSDAALWRDATLQAIGAAEKLADIAIEFMNRENEDAVNEALSELQSVPSYWQLRDEAREAA